jgi:O-antigen/teichoic acid export membrane protein
MLTRTVSKTEYGIWGNLNDILAYFILIANVIPFWTTRFVARKHAGSAKTGLVANLFLSLISTAVYIVTIPLITSALQISPQYIILYAVVSIQIIELYTLLALQSIVYAFQPHALGYGLLSHEITKVVCAYLFVINFRMGLFGGVLSLIGAYLIQVFFYFGLSRKYLIKKIEWRYFKEWLKASPINIFNVVGMQLSTFALIFLFIYGTKIARAYYGVSFQIASIVRYSSFLAFALYPKLLAKISSEDVTSALKLVFRFAIPMTAGAIILADSYLATLSKVYKEATLVLQLLALNMLCVTLSQVLNNVILGVEKIDEKSDIPFKQLLRSRLFQSFALPYVRAVIILPSSFYILTAIAQTPLQAAIYVASVFFIASVIMLICRYTLAQKTLRFIFPWKSLAKYFIASVAMSVMLIIIPHPERLLATLIITLLGGLVYIVALLIVDVETKELVRLTIDEIRIKFVKFLRRWK